jgi:hypothetical protein
MFRHQGGLALNAHLFIIRLVAAVVAASLSCVLVPLLNPQAAAAADVIYPQSDELIANPERGRYHHNPDHCDAQEYNETTLRNYRDNEKVTLMLCVFYLSEFKNGPISQSQLDFFNTQAGHVRNTGLKMILRFAYSDVQYDPSAASNEDTWDAPVNRVLQHINQLSWYLKVNRDVIAVVQSGFVGTWGEGHYSKHFGIPHDLTNPPKWSERKQVTDRLLRAFPNTQHVQLRTVEMKQTMYPSLNLAPLNLSTAHNGSDLARLGFHNDCFLGGSTDANTWRNDAERTYLGADSAFVPVGGETCPPGPRTNCPTALSEMAGFHWSFLGIEWNQPALDLLAPCMPTIERNLGYRLALISSSSPALARARTAMTVRIQIRNSGYAAPYNARPVVLILRNMATGTLYEVPTDADPRKWAPNSTITLEKKFTSPSRAGRYELLLNLPDTYASLAGNPCGPAQCSPGPAYSIRMANQESMWESGTGFNRLNASVLVLPRICPFWFC